MDLSFKRFLVSSLLSIAVLFLFPSASVATIINLSFSGNVDASGARVGGVDAPFDSAFTLDIAIDDALAALGQYAVQTISFTTSVGSHTTLGPWAGSIVADSTGAFSNLSFPGESPGSSQLFFMNVSGAYAGLGNDPTTWSAVGLTGDFLARGVGGNSTDHLSGITGYSGQLSLAVLVVPEPSTALLLGLGFAGLGWRGRVRQP
jgi:hypothetical protein